MVGIPWWSSDLDSMLPLQGTWVQSLVRELDPMCHNLRKKIPHTTTKDPACHSKDGRSNILQLRPGTDK